MTSTLRAAFLCLDLAAASTRVRITDHLPGLAERGVHAEVHALPKGSARRKLLRSLSADVVVLQRVLLGELDLATLRRTCPALVLDMDDAIYRRPHKEGGPRLKAKFEGTVQACDVVICGNQHLRDRLRERHPRVRLLPPVSPPPEQVPTRDDHDGPLRLVWIGSEPTLPYLRALGPTLQGLGEEVRLEVVADAEPDLGFELTFTPWSLQAEEEALGRADVGLYPLRDDGWSQGKCAYKLQRYMQFGLPSVASPHGAGADVLAAPEAGLLAETPAEWEAALRKLADPAERRRMGARARARALALFSLADRTQTLENILREAAAIGRARSPS